LQAGRSTATSPDAITAPNHSLGPPTLIAAAAPASASSSSPTQRAHAQTRAWIAQHNIFADTGMGCGSYEDSVLPLRGVAEPARSLISPTIVGIHSGRQIIVKNYLEIEKYELELDTVDRLYQMWRALSRLLTGPER
jgi:hypothetical protein